MIILCAVGKKKSPNELCTVVRAKNKIIVPMNAFVFCSNLQRRWTAAMFSLRARCVDTSNGGKGVGLLKLQYVCVLSKNQLK